MQLITFGPAGFEAYARLRFGARRAAIDALIRDPQLDVVAARPAERQPEYR
jgi:hypothetical protein